MSEKLNTKKYESHEELPEPVYYIESSDDDTVLVGIDVAIDKNDDNTTTVTWFDTNKERSMTAEETRSGIGYFAFKRADEEGGQFYLFKPMDLDIYNNKVKDKLTSPPEFTNVEDLIEAFKNTTE